MISKTGISAAKALAVLAKIPDREYAGSAAIAKEIGAPQNYLGKLLKALASEGLVESQKGFGGGFRLARPAAKISLFDVVEPIDKVSRWGNCFLGNGRCNEHDPCAVHDRWKRVREEYLGFLRETTIADLAGRDSGTDD
ncbi:MAG: Rrf2 family transcriptional regulator [candidate division Zixibacteria bacterium]|jgi:Rrf2 family protein|nr:Rrf2 family transcriptional regulator [candidate division Zixibacteria bacterium]